MNASGTPLQMNGAAYGSGIYLSPHSSVSVGYSGYHHHNRKPKEVLVAPFQLLHLKALFAGKQTVSEQS